ncbi:MAG TPA: YtxH domain-containing protein [Balneolales bacterium]|nr:YtxH domain-containing protein [Balneolales bacterium]
MTATKSNITYLLLSAGSFLSGIALGFLMTPRSGKENRKWITSQTQDLVDWVEENSKNALDTTEKRLQMLRSNMHNTIPDLYVATENLGIDESELIE